MIVLMKWRKMTHNGEKEGEKRRREKKEKEGRERRVTLGHDPLVII